MIHEPTKQKILNHLVQEHTFMSERYAEGSLDPHLKIKMDFLMEVIEDLLRFKPVTVETILEGFENLPEEEQKKIISTLKDFVGGEG